MTSLSTETEQHYIALNTLIRRIRSCIPTGHTTSQRRSDREYQLQLCAFEERCEQVQNFAERLTASRCTSPLLVEGETHRLHQALALSLEFFRNHPVSGHACESGQVFRDAVPAA